MVDDFVKRGRESKEVVRVTLRFPDIMLVPWVASSLEVESFCAMRLRREDKSRASMWWLEFVITNGVWKCVMCIDLDVKVELCSIEVW